MLVQVWVTHWVKDRTMRGNNMIKVDSSSNSNSRWARYATLGGMNYKLITPASHANYRVLSVDTCVLTINVTLLLLLLVLV